MGEILKRFTEAEDAMILANWWDPSKRGEVVRKLGRSKGSITFRYYRLLREKGIDPRVHRARMQMRAQAEAMKAHGEVEHGEALRVQSEVDRRLDRLEATVSGLTLQMERLECKLDDYAQRFDAWLAGINRTSRRYLRNESRRGTVEDVSEKLEELEATLAFTNRLAREVCVTLRGLSGRSGGPQKAEGAEDSGEPEMASLSDSDAEDLSCAELFAALRAIEAQENAYEDDTVAKPSEMPTGTQTREPRE